MQFSASERSVTDAKTAAELQLYVLAGFLQQLLLSACQKIVGHFHCLVDCTCQLRDLSISRGTFDWGVRPLSVVCDL